MAPISPISLPYVCVDNTGFNVSSSSSAEARLADQEKDTAEDNAVHFPSVYVDNRDFNFRQLSYLEEFLGLVKGALYDLFLPRLTNGKDLLNLAYVNKNFYTFLSGYFPKREKDPLSKGIKNPYKVRFPRQFQSTLKGDEWSRNRSLSILYWFTQKYPELAPVVYKKLLARSDYRITLAGKAPNRTAKIAPKMIEACVGCSATARLFATAAEEFFKKKYNIQSDEWLRILKEHNIVYESFSTQPEEGQVQFSIAPIYSLWLNYPDVDTQLQNAAHLAQLIHNATVTQDEDYQEQVGRVFAEFLLDHPVRKRESVFVQMLAMIVAEFSRRPSIRLLWSSFSQVFESTLSQDRLALDPATLLDMAAVLSKKITISYPWEPIWGIARHLDQIG